MTNPLKISLKKGAFEKQVKEKAPKGFFDDEASGKPTSFGGRKL